MKKAKLLPLSILGAAVLIVPPIAALTSCSQKATTNAIPVEMLDIQNNILYGLKSKDMGEVISKYDTISIPANVIAISPTAFSTETAPDSGKYVGTFSRVWNSTIRNIVFEPNSQLTVIGEHAFDGCDAFTSNLSFPNGLLTIGKAAFAGCSYLTGDINLPNSVKTIGESAFEGCDGFAGGITFSTHLNSIGKAAFKGCSHLGLNRTEQKDTSVVTLPSGITKLNESIFENCAYLTKVVLNKTTSEIGDYAFRGCKGLKFVGYADSETQQGLYLNTNVLKLGKQAFKDAGLYSVNLDAFADTTAIPTDWKGQGEAGDEIFTFYQRKPGDATLNAAWEGKAGKEVWSAYCTKNGCTQYPSHELTNDDLVIEGKIIKDLVPEVKNNIAHWNEDVSLTININGKLIGGIDRSFLSDATPTDLDQKKLERITKLTINFEYEDLKEPVSWTVPQFLNLTKLKTLELKGSGNAFLRVPAFIDGSPTINGFKIKPYHNTLQSLTLQNVFVEENAYCAIGDEPARFDTLHEINNLPGDNVTQPCVTRITSNAFNGAGHENNLIVRGSENIIFDDLVKPDNTTEPCKAPFANSYITSNFIFNEVNKYVPISCFENCPYLSQVTFQTKVDKSKYLVRDAAFKNTAGQVKKGEKFATICNLNGTENLTFTDDKNVDSQNVFVGSTITSLNTMELDANVPAGIFSGTTLYNNVSFGKNCTKIGAKAFENTVLKSPYTLTIPSTITSIGDEAFSGANFARLDFKDFVDKGVPTGFSENKVFAFATKWTLPATDDEWWTLRFGNAAEAWKTYLAKVIE